MLINRFLFLFITLSLTIFKNVDAGYSVSVVGKKLQYTGTGVDFKINEIILSSNKVLPDYSIPFTCDTTNANAPVCKSADLDFTKLAGLVTVKASKLATPNTIYQIDQSKTPIPYPVPTEVKWEPPTTAGAAAPMSGNFLLFGADVSSISGNYNSRAVSLGIASNTDATKLSVKSSGGYGTIKLIINSQEFVVNFANPVISTVTLNNGLIAITGQNFWIDKKVINVKLGQDDISSFITSSDTSKIQITYDSKYSSNSSILVTVGTNAQTVPYYVIIPSVPQSVDKEVSKGVGGLITISGKCLKGSGTSETTVSVGAYACKVVSQLSTDLMCQLPPATTQNGSKNLKVVVTIDGIKSTNELLYSYGIPQITKIDQKTGSTLFTITGSNLGKSDSSIKALNSGSTVALNLLVIGFDDEKESYLTFNLPTNFSKSSISVYDGQDASNQFSVSPTPYISKISSLPSTEGQEIVFVGGYLDPTSKTSISLLDSRNQSVDCSNFAIGSDSSSASCKLSPGCGSIKSTILVDQTSMEVDFNYQSPSSLIATQLADNKLQITGKNLGPNSKFIKVDINGNDLTASSLENGTATFDLPSNFLSDPNALISVDGISNSISDVLNINLEPVAKSISSSDTSGSKVTVTGSFFSAKDNNNLKIMVANQSCDSLTIVNGQTLTCSAPPGSGVKNAVSFLFKNSESKFSSPLFLAYNPPTIISSTSVKQKEGGMVTIYGTNFEQTLITVNVGNKSCGNVSVIDSTKLTCSIISSNVDPLLTNKKLAVDITVNGQSVSNQVFEYDNEALNTETPKPTSKPTSKPTDTPKPTPTPVEKHTENNNSIIISHSSILIFSLLLILQLL
ncbi:hypothetical protein RB653_008663 [Dictyostelium firmibasis]|uniref:IPT/TIG domain-containing protein n=1 Tax=Dictyostelium firmibasis TaxID=79012 RepID=A0AAN7TRF3_9MYCE